MTITGLHHMMLTVTDLTRSTDFYEQVLGLNRFRAVPDDGVAGAKVIFTLPDGHFFGIVAHQGGDHAPFTEKHTGLDHVSFTVPAAELTQWQQRLTTEGYPTSEPAPALSGELTVVVRDPDNIQVQILGRQA